MASAAEQLAANMNFEAFSKATELHKRIWFTLIAMVIYRLGTYIPIPGIDPAAFAEAFQGTGLVVRLVCLAGEEQRVTVESQSLYMLAGVGHHRRVVIERPPFVSTRTDAAVQLHRRL